MKYDTAAPYIASYVIMKQGKKIAFVYRTKTDWMNNYYGLPSGKVEKDEPYTLAAIREAKEEVGVDVAPEDLQPILTVHRDGRDTDTSWVDVYFVVDKWQGEPYNAEPDKHGKVEWLDEDNLPENVIPSVADALKQIKAGKTYSEFGWS